MINTSGLVIGEWRGMDGKGGGEGGRERKRRGKKKKNLGVLRDMAVSLLVTELVAMELVLPLVGGRSNRLTARIVSSLRSFSSLPVSLASPFSSTFLLLSSLLRACTAPFPGSYSGAHHNPCIPCIRVRLSLSRGFRLSLCMQYIITPP